MSKKEKTQGKAGKFFKSTKAEIKKVIWPTNKELMSFTGVVVFTCAVFSIGTWILDSLFGGAINLIIK